MTAQIIMTVGLRPPKAAPGDPRAGPPQVQRLKRLKLNSKNPDDHAAIKALKQEAGGGMVQTRGPEGKSEDKRRITILHRMFLQHTVQMKGRRWRPKGKLGRTEIVLT